MQAFEVTSISCLPVWSGRRRVGDNGVEAVLQQDQSAIRLVVTQAESPDAPRRRPDHRFIQHSCDHSAMHDALKSGVMFGGCEVGVVLQDLAAATQRLRRWPDRHPGPSAEDLVVSERAERGRAMFKQTAFAMLSAWMAIPGVALADAVATSINIDAGSLSRGLDTLEKQTGAEILFDPNWLELHRSTGQRSLLYQNPLLSSSQQLIAARFTHPASDANAA